MTLYEINASLNELIENSIDQETGELQINQDQLEELQLARYEKRENMALYLKNLLSEIDAIRAEEIYLAARRKKIEKRYEYLKSLLENDLKVDEFSTARVEITYRKSNAVEIEDGFIPWAAGNAPSFIRYKLPEPDKKAISDYIKRGNELPYARIVERKSMTIK